VGALREKNYYVPVLLDYYGKVLTEKQREVVDLYYNEDLSLAEISEHAGITRQGVRDSIKRGEAQLLDLEEKLGLVGRVRSMEAALVEIRSVMEEIDRYAAANVYVRPVMEMAERVKALIEPIRLE